MKLRSVALLIAAAYLLLFAGHAWHLKRTVYGDGVYYYSWLRSVIVDRDIDFSNEYARAGVSAPRTREGRMGNKYSIGPALLWAPAYLTTHLLVRGDGWGFVYQLSVGAVSVLSAVTGLLLLTRFIGPALPGHPVTLLLVAGATNLLFYGAIDPVNSHALSFFAATVFLSLLATQRKHWFGIGIALAIIGSIRLQDLIYVIALVPLLRHVRWTALLSGATIGFLPQLAAWYALYGTLANPYIAGGETFTLLRPHILGVLFGNSSGLLLWTPTVAVGIVGLLRHSRRYWPYIWIFGFQLYLVSTWSTWWQGASVSGRMFVSTLPVIAIGIQAIVHSLYKDKLLRSILPLLAFGMTIMNLIGVFYYLFTY